MIDDLSFSGLTNLIQGDTTKAADVLVEIAEEKEQLINEIEKTQNKLRQLKTRCDIIDNGANFVVRHLDKEFPLVVTKKDFIVVITGGDITIEKNII